jgi:maleate cis-trans isomerase
MFESIAPTLTIGWLQPSSVVDVAAYEFYRMAPPGIMLVLLPLGRSEFPGDDDKESWSELDDRIDKLIERDVEVIVQSGAPAPLLSGMEAHDRAIEYLATRSGVPATSTILCVVRAAANLELANLAAATFWDEAVNGRLAEFFPRSGIAICGFASRPTPYDAFHRLGAAAQMQLAYELGKSAFLANPRCDGVYLAGGAWLTADVAMALEAEFGRPVITHRTAMLRHSLQLANAWRPIPGHGRVLAAS